jgi:hypothetical protein
VNEMILLSMVIALVVGIIIVALVMLAERKK